jgi:hypothetical protein
MSAARLPLAYRDSCAHLLIPLNRCRHEEYYLPWKCEVRRARPHLVACANCSRPSDTPTKSASTRSSSYGWPRWTSCGQPRTASGAIETETRIEQKRCMYISTTQPPVSTCPSYKDSIPLAYLWALGFFTHRVPSKGTRPADRYNKGCKHVYSAPPNEMSLSTASPLFPSPPSHAAPCAGFYPTVLVSRWLHRGLHNIYRVLWDGIDKVDPSLQPLRLGHPLSKPALDLVPELRGGLLLCLWDDIGARILFSVTTGSQWSASTIRTVKRTLSRQ